jgi:hypothetical protein
MLSWPALLLGSATLFFPARLQHRKTSPLYFVSFCANDDDYDRPQTNHITLQYRRFLWVLLLSATTFLDLCYLPAGAKEERILATHINARLASLRTSNRVKTRQYGRLATLENLLGRKLSGRSLLELSQLELSTNSWAKVKTCLDETACCTSGLIERALFFLSFCFTMDELPFFRFVLLLLLDQWWCFSSEAVIEEKTLHTMDAGKRRHKPAILALDFERFDFLAWDDDDNWWLILMDWIDCLCCCKTRRDFESALSVDW